MKELAGVNGVERAINPFDTQGSAISKDGKIAYSTISLKREAGSVDKSTKDGVNAVVSGARSNFLDVEMGGDIISKVPGEILGAGEIGGVVFALILLIVTLGALVAAGFPIVVALVSVGAGTLGLFGLSRVIDVSSTTPVLAVMLGLAVGIDYSLFIINKYRYYLLHGYGYMQAMGHAIATAGNAAGGTLWVAINHFPALRW